MPVTLTTDQLSHQRQQLPSARNVTVFKGGTDYPLHGFVRVPTSLLLLPAGVHGVQDGVGGVEYRREHRGQLGTTHTLVATNVEYAEEKAALVAEGAVQHHRQTTDKLLKADRTILDR